MPHPPYFSVALQPCPLLLARLLGDLTSWSGSMRSGLWESPPRGMLGEWGAEKAGKEGSL